MRRRLRAIALRLRKVYGPPPAPRRLPPLDELILTVLSQHTSDTNRDARTRTSAHAFQPGRGRRRAAARHRARYPPRRPRADEGDPIRAILRALRERGSRSTSTAVGHGAPRHCGSCSSRCRVSDRRRPRACCSSRSTDRSFLSTRTCTASHADSDWSTNGPTLSSLRKCCRRARHRRRCTRYTWISSAMDARSVSRADRTARSAFSRRCARGSVSSTRGDCRDTIRVSALEVGCDRVDRG